LLAILISYRRTGPVWGREKSAATKAKLVLSSFYPVTHQEEMDVRK